jgi:C4-dicarboxylate-specific signal transduction histidine kinase
MNTCGHSERNYRKSRILRSSIDRGWSGIAGHLRVHQGSGNPGAAFLLDLTSCKEAEAEARESGLRHREMQTELAHANRITTMGKLTASISHEVNQPLTAMVTNAGWIVNHRT